MSAESSQPCDFSGDSRDSTVDANSTVDVTIGSLTGSYNIQQIVSY